MAVHAEDIRLLANQPFRRLLESRVIGQTAQNALFYTLLILVVERTGSSMGSTGLLIALTLPSVFLGIPAGTLVDLLPKRFTLITGYMLKGLISVGLILYGESVWSLFLLAAGLSAVNQFFMPAESTIVPAIVRRDQIPAANALMVFILILGQVMGMVALAPLLLRIEGETTVFALVTVLFVAATYFVARVQLSRREQPSEDSATSIGFLDATRLGFRLMLTNRRAYLAITYLIISGSLSKLLVILLPKYTEDVLHISAKDTVFVATPAAIGAGVGLTLTPLLAKLFGSWRVAGFGLVMFLFGLAGLGLIVYVRDFIEANLDFGISFVEKQVGVSSVITVTMALAIPIGFAFTMISVAARAVMNEEAPYYIQGRLFSVQFAIADLLSLLPLLLVGAIADLVGVRATLIASVAASAGVAGYLTFSRRIGPQRSQPVEPAPQRF